MIKRTALVTIHTLATFAKSQMAFRLFTVMSWCMHHIFKIRNKIRENAMPLSHRAG